MGAFRLFVLLPTRINLRTSNTACMPIYLYLPWLPWWPLTNPRAHRFKGPLSPASPKFRQNLFHPPRHSHLLVGCNNLAILDSIYTIGDTHVYDLKRSSVFRLRCDREYDFMHLLWCEHRCEG